MTITIQTVDGSAACACGNCDWKGTADRLQPIDDIGARLDAGSIVPAGECPSCGALAYLSAPAVVWTYTQTNRHGTGVELFRTDAAAYAAAAEYCRARWSIYFDADEEAPADDRECVATFYAGHHDEECEIEAAPING